MPGYGRLRVLGRFVFERDPALVAAIAEKLRDSRKDADIGEVFIATDTGKVVKNDLKIERVD